MKAKEKARYRNPFFVVAVMLADGRPAMVQRAVRSFMGQIYDNSALLIWNTGADLSIPLSDEQAEHAHVERGEKKSIGFMRNDANDFAVRHMGADVIAHWDSDDWSEPGRIEQQVQLLWMPTVHIVGYRSVLFWRERQLPDIADPRTPYFPRRGGVVGEAWLYAHRTKPVGASLCYWADIWKARKFEDLPRAAGGTGEDSRFIETMNTLAVEPISPDIMVCGIHGKNTMPYDIERMQAAGSLEWKRAPKWDKFCAEVMHV